MRTFAFVGLVGAVVASATPTACSSPRCADAPLTDAPITWSIDFAGSSPIIAAAPNGNFVVAAKHGKATTFGTTPIPDGADVVVAEITPLGSVVWLQTIGATDETPGDIAADEQGNVYVVGTSQSKTLVLAGTTFTNTAAQFAEMAFVVRLAAADGAPLWGKAYPNATGNATARSVAVGGGKLVMTGGLQTSLSFDAVTATVKQYAYGGYVVALDASTGAALWADAVNDDNGKAQIAGAAISSTGAIGIAIPYEGTLSGLTFPTPPPTTATFEMTTLLAVLSTDGAVTADVALQNSTQSTITASDVLLDGAGDFLAVGGYTSPASFGSFTAPTTANMFVYAFDASLAGKSLATLEQSPYFAVAPIANHVAVATSARSDTKGTIPDFAGQKLATPLGPSNTDALVVGVVDEASGDFVRGYAIPPFTRVQPGDPGSLRTSGIAAGADGRLVVVATLDGKVNLERCAVASDPDATHVVILSISP